MIADYWNAAVKWIKDTIRLLSVQVTLLWGTVWAVFGSLSPDVIAELAQLRLYGLSVVTWLGISQAVTTVIARKIPQAPK